MTEEDQGNPLVRAALKRPMGQRFLVGTFYRWSTTMSDAYIKTNTNLAFIGPDLMFKLGTSEETSDGVIFAAKIGQSLIYDGRYRPSRYQNWSVTGVISPKKFFSNFLFAAEKENQQFGNVREFGAGIRMNMNDIIWVKAGIQTGFSLWNLVFLWNLQAGKCFYASSEFSKALALSGTKVEWDILLGFFDKIGLNWMVGHAQMSSNLNLQMAETSTMLSIRYTIPK